ncbi:MAG: alpha/beta fold hydrolase [Lysinibacillus sp.]
MKKSWWLLILSCLAVVLVGCNDEKDKEKADDSNGFIGNWQGELQIPNEQLAFELKLAESSGSLSVPAQNAKDIPFLSVKYDGDVFEAKLLIDSKEIIFNGKLDGERIEGTYTEGVVDYPFYLNRGEIEDVEDETTTDIPVENGVLKTYLQLPEDEGPHPLMIIIAGSGPTDRDGNTVGASGKNNSYKLLAEELAQEGIATLRYDKRGIGENMALAPSEIALTFDSYINDATAIIEAMKKDERFSKVGVIGHSEGSLIGMYAAKKAQTDSFISLAGAGRPIDEVLKEQLKGQLPPTLQKESDDILAQLKEGKLVNQVSPALNSLYRPSVQPYMISWLALNPVEAIATLEMPTLIVQGTTDLQVKIEDAHALKAANAEAELALIDKMNHVLKEAPQDQTANMATYVNPDLPLAPGLTEKIVKFIKG